MSPDEAPQLKRLPLSPDGIEIAKIKLQAVMQAQRELEAFIGGYASAVGLAKRKLQLDPATWELVYEAAVLREVPSGGQERTGTPES